MFDNIFSKLTKWAAGAYYSKTYKIKNFQVTCEYLFEQGACIPRRVHTVVVSLQHSEKISLENLREEVMEKVIKAVIPNKYIDEKTTVHINPCGLFIIGGPMVSFMKKSYSNSIIKLCKNEMMHLG